MSPSPAQPRPALSLPQAMSGARPHRLSPLHTVRHHFVCFVLHFLELLLIDLFRITESHPGLAKAVGPGRCWGVPGGGEKVITNSGWACIIFSNIGGHTLHNAACPAAKKWERLRGHEAACVGVICVAQSHGTA